MHGIISLIFFNKFKYCETCTWFECFFFSFTFWQDEIDSFKSHGQQDFLATADYLGTYGINSLILNMQSAAKEVLKEYVIIAACP